MMQDVLTHVDTAQTHLETAEKVIGLFKGLCSLLHSVVKGSETCFSEACFSEACDEECRVMATNINLVAPIIYHVIKHDTSGPQGSHYLQEGLDYCLENIIEALQEAVREIYNILSGDQIYAIKVRLKKTPGESRLKNINDKLIFRINILNSYLLCTPPADRQQHGLQVATAIDVNRLHGHLSDVLQHLQFIATEKEIRQQDLATAAIQRNSTAGQELYLYAHSKGIFVAVSPDGQFFATCAGRVFVKVWDAAAGKALHQFDCHAEVWHAAWMPGSTILATPYKTMSVMLWNVSKRGAEQHRELQVLCGAAPWHFAWNPDARMLVATSRAEDARHRVLHLWDAFSGEYMQTQSRMPCGASIVTWSPDGRFLATGGTCPGLQIWSTQWAMCIRYFTPQNSTSAQDPTKLFVVTCMDFSSNGNEIAVGGRDKYLRICDIATGAVTQLPQYHRCDVADVAWSPDGRLIASAAYFDEVYVWDAVSLSRIRVLSSVGIFSSVAWSPCSTFLLRGSRRDFKFLLNAVRVNRMVPTLSLPTTSGCAPNASTNDV